jgi:hypothetical protein
MMTIVTSSSRGVEVMAPPALRKKIHDAHLKAAEINR